MFAVFDYAPQNADELPLTNGEPLSVLRKGDEVEREWWWTTGGEPPRDGYVPRNLLGVSRGCCGGDGEVKWKSLSNLPGNGEES